MSLADLKVNSLYVIIFLRNDPPTPDDFHWGLYLHRSPFNGGTKYHIKNQGAGWIADHGPTAGVFKSFLLIGLVRIADIPNGLETHVDKLLRTYDNQLNNAEITCRVWLLRVLALLQRPVNGVIIFRCTDIHALEREIKDWGNSHAQSALDNQQPRPVTTSSQCGL